MDPVHIPSSKCDKGMQQNEFYGTTLNCASRNREGGCVAASGEDIVKNSGLNTPYLGEVTLLNIGMEVVFFVIGMYAFNRITRPLLKLK